jgi:hypothetical protein
LRGEKKSRKKKIPELSLKLKPILWKISTYSKLLIHVIRKAVKRGQRKKKKEKKKKQLQ